MFIIPQYEHLLKTDSLAACMEYEVVNYSANCLIIFHPHVVEAAIYDRLDNLHSEKF